MLCTSMMRQHETLACAHKLDIPLGKRRRHQMSWQELVGLEKRAMNDAILESCHATHDPSLITAYEKHFTHYPVELWF